MSLWTEKDWWPRKQQYFALYFAFEADNFVDKTSVTKWSQGKPIAKEVKTMVSQKKKYNDVNSALILSMKLLKSMEGSFE